MCFQSAELPTRSHSQVVEWISGSFIQSHWPCMMLWPSSMFSRILATPSTPAPIAQTVRLRAPKYSSVREPISSPRCRRMMLWMYL